MKVHEAIIKIRTEMKQSVHKNGFNNFHKYKFAKATDVIAHCRDLCNKYELAIIPQGVTDINWSKNDQVMTGIAKFLLLTDEDGVEVSVLAAGEDKSDKHAYKAMTGALKYLLIQVFLLETDDDPEKDDSPEEKKPKMSKKQLEQALPRIDEEGEAYYLKLQQHFALSELQEAELMERIAYNKQ